MADPLLAYVTNADRPVFALRNLPPGTLAALFARDARAGGDLRASLRRLIDEGWLGAPTPGLPGQDPERVRERERADLAAYGHGSIAEHAVVHLAVERCSLLASRALEGARFAAYTEQSTRAALADDATEPVIDVGLPPAHSATYQTAARESLRVRAQLLPEVAQRLTERAAAAATKRRPSSIGGEDGDAGDARNEENARRRASELLAGLVPVGAPTSLRLTINARALEHHIAGLLSSPLDEVRRLAELMREEARLVVPTFLTRTEPRPHRAEVRERVMRAHGGLHTAAVGERPIAQLIDAPPDPLRTLATAIQVELFGTAWESAWSVAADADRADAIVRAYLADRAEDEAPLRALEQLVFRFEVSCEYSAWRDLSRHRPVSATTPRLTAQEGYSLPEELVELGVAPKVRAALERAADAYGAIAASHPWHAQYVVPMAYHVRFIAQCNLRELFYVAEQGYLREERPAFRQVAIALANATREVCPWLGESLRVPHPGPAA